MKFEHKVHLEEILFHVAVTQFLVYDEKCFVLGTIPNAVSAP